MRHPVISESVLIISPTWSKRRAAGCADAAAAARKTTRKKRSSMAGNTSVTRAIIPPMSNDVMHDGRRGFVRRAMGLTGLGVAGFAAQAQDRPGTGGGAGQGPGGGQGDARFMPRYAR